MIQWLLHVCQEELKMWLQFLPGRTFPTFFQYWRAELFVALCFSQSWWTEKYAWAAISFSVQKLLKIIDIWSATEYYQMHPIRVRTATQVSTGINSYFLKS